MLSSCSLAYKPVRFSSERRVTSHACFPILLTSMSSSSSPSCIEVLPPRRSSSSSSVRDASDPSSPRGHQAVSAPQASSSSSDPPVRRRGTPRVATSQGVNRSAMHRQQIRRGASRQRRVARTSVPSVPRRQISLKVPGNVRHARPKTLQVSRRRPAPVIGNVPKPAAPATQPSPSVKKGLRYRPIHRPPSLLNQLRQLPCETPLQELPVCCRVR